MAALVICCCAAGLGVGVCGLGGGAGFFAASFAGGLIAARLVVTLRVFGAHLGVFAVAALGGLALSALFAAGHFFVALSFTAGHGLSGLTILAVAAGHFGLCRLRLGVWMFTAGAGGFIRRLGGIRGLRGELWSGGLLSDDGQPGGDEQNQKNCGQSEFHFFSPLQLETFYVGSRPHAGTSWKRCR